MINKLILVVAAVASATSANAAVNLITNPSFETGFGVDEAKVAGSSDIFGWEVARAGGVFYSESTFGASDGSRSVELAGTGAGSIRQLVETNIGYRYTFSFDYAADPLGSGNTVVGTAAVNGIGNIPIHFTRSSEASAENPGWLTATYTFVADRSVTRVAFLQGTVGTAGLLIDNVSLSVVPEPATWGLMIAGFGMVGMSMRRRRTVVVSN